MLTDHSPQNQSGFAERQIAANFLKAPLQLAHGLYPRTLRRPLGSGKPAGHDELFQGWASPPQVAPRTRPNVRRRFPAARATVASQLRVPLARVFARQCSSITLAAQSDRQWCPALIVSDCRYGAGLGVSTNAQLTFPEKDAVPQMSPNPFKA